MPFNKPTFTTNNISFGPARVFIGPSGTTPTLDVGAITEDGVSMEITAEMRKIVQGNPKVTIFTFTQVQSVLTKFTSIEWNFTHLSEALGSGNTTATAAKETFAFGGDPVVQQLALHVQHQMQSGQTMNMYVWTAQSAGGVTIPFTHDEHAFEYNFEAVQSDTNWAGVTLAQEEQLMLAERILV